MYITNQLKIYVVLIKNVKNKKRALLVIKPANAGFMGCFNCLQLKHVKQLELMENMEVTTFIVETGNKTYGNRNKRKVYI